MQNDEEDRRDRPASQPEAERPDAEQPQEPTEGAEPAPGGGWPAEDIEAAPPAPDEPRPWSTEPPAAGTSRPDAWPTEPPAAEAPAPADAWPTSSPERSETTPVAGQEEMEAPAAPPWEPEVGADAAATSPAWQPAPEAAEPPPVEAAEPPSVPEPVVEAAQPPPAWEPVAAPAPEEWPRQEGPLHEPPPSEVEAYPGAGAVGPAAAAAASSAHSVPDSGAALGESTLCPRCGTENRPGLAFCRNCGQRLMAAGVAPTVERPSAPEGTQACPRCGTHNRAGVAFCQNCGANLRTTEAGYVPPAVAPAETTARAAEARGGAILGPIVLIIGLVGIATAYLLPFAYGSTNSLYERAAGSGGYGISFWNGYPDVTGGLADQAYFGLAAPAPIIGLLLLLLAIAGFVRAAPGPIQRIGLLITLLWSIGVIVLFVIVEVLANWSGDVVGLLRVLSPAGIILVLASLIVLIGTLTRLARS
jgi:hypothetical protein